MIDMAHIVLPCDKHCLVSAMTYLSRSRPQQTATYIPRHSLFTSTLALFIPQIPSLPLNHTHHPSPVPTLHMHACMHTCIYLHCSWMMKTCPAFLFFHLGFKCCQKHPSKCTLDTLSCLSVTPCISLSLDDALVRIQNNLVQMKPSLFE